jgi:hypothetical protein
MSKLNQDDMQDIIKIFENELNTLRGVPKVEKMKLRKRIVNVLNPALTVSNPRADAIMRMVDDKLDDVLDLFLDKYGFKKKFSYLLSEKLRK